MTTVILAVKGHPLYRGSRCLDDNASSVVAAVVAARSLQHIHTHIHIYLPTLSLAHLCPHDSAQLLFVDGRILGGLVDIALPRFSHSNSNSSSSSSSLLYLYSRLRAVLVAVLQVGGVVVVNSFFAVVVWIIRFCDMILSIHRFIYLSLHPSIHLSIGDDDDLCSSSADRSSSNGSAAMSSECWCA